MASTWLIWMGYLAMMTSIPFVMAASSSSSSNYPSGFSKYAVATLNASCSRVSDCSGSMYQTYLICVKSRCVCEHYAAFDNYEGQCRIKHHVQCKIQRLLSDVVQPCVRFGNCAYPLDHSGFELKTSIQGICHCNINRTPNPDGTCSSARSNAPSTGFFILLTCCALFMAFTLFR